MNPSLNSIEVAPTCDRPIWQSLTLLLEPLDFIDYFQISNQLALMFKSDHYEMLKVGTRHESIYNLFQKIQFCCYIEDRLASITFQVENWFRLTEPQFLYHLVYIKY